MPERAEIEAVAEAVRLAPSGAGASADARVAAERAIEALDHVRDARGDDDHKPRCSRCGHLVQSHALKGKGPCMVGCGCQGEDHEPDERAFDSPLGAHQRTQTQRDVADILEFGSPQGEHEYRAKVRAKIEEGWEPVDAAWYWHSHPDFRPQGEDHEAPEFDEQAITDILVAIDDTLWGCGRERMDLIDGPTVDALRDAVRRELVAFVARAGESNEGGNQNDERRH